MYDIRAHFNNTHHTWSNGSSSSKIDYIWTDQFNIQFLLSYNLDQSNTSTSSDHLILSSSWTFPNAYSKPLRTVQVLVIESLTIMLWPKNNDQNSLILLHPISILTTHLLHLTLKLIFKQLGIKLNTLSSMLQKN